MKKFKKKSKRESKTSSTLEAHSTRNRPRIIVVLGPTSSGKSEFAVQLALAFGGEIVSADSRQVYRGLNISSSKVPGKWERKGTKYYFIYKGVIHHLIDIISPRKQFSAWQYKKKATRAIGNILGRGKLPIIAGGTGFYIRTITHNLDLPKVPPVKKLRKDLEKLTTEQLVNRLKGLDPRRASDIDINNRRRLIRAIEIIVFTKSQIPPLDVSKEGSPYDVLEIGIRLPDELLKERINSVVDERVRNGVVREIEQLHKRGLSWKRIENLGLEYRYIASHIKGEIDIETMKKSIKHGYHSYAKRQMTWFKRNKDIIWVDAPEKAFPIVRDFLKH